VKGTVVRVMATRRVNAPLWSIVVLFALAVVIAVAAYFAAVHGFQVSQAAQARQAAAQQASQQRQGVVFERKLCTTLERLASREPPPAPPGNPSRAYLQWQHGVLAELGPDVGCKELNLYR
jgi:hypothetical protein